MGGAKKLSWKATKWGQLFLRYRIYLEILIIVIAYEAGIVWWKIAIFIIFLGLTRILLQWSAYMSALRQIESMIWGRPLDKEYWSKGEKPQFPKIRIWKWRKKEY